MNNSTLNIKNMPRPIKERDHWVCYKLEPEQKNGKPVFKENGLPKIKKMPKDSKTGKNSGADLFNTWHDLNSAKEGCEKFNFDGIGYFFTEEDNIVAIDFDDCYNSETGEFEEDAAEILSMQQPMYAEFSQSGNGIHILLQGKKPGRKCRKNNKNGHSREMYDTGRYFALTGNLLPQSSVDIPVANSETIECIYNTLFYSVGKKAKKSENSTRCNTISLSDKEIVEKIKSSKQASKFTALYDYGDKSEYNNDASAADSALCTILIWWCNHDLVLADRIFRNSALYRAKWDEMHGSCTYGQMTLSEADKVVSGGYSPKNSAEDKKTTGKKTKVAEEPQAESSAHTEPAENNRVIDSPIYEKNGCYYYETKGKAPDTKLTNFLIKPQKIVYDEEKEESENKDKSKNEDKSAQFIGEIIPNCAKRKRIPFVIKTISLSSASSFKKELSKNGIDLSYYGNDKNLEELKNYVSRAYDCKEIKGISRCGFVPYNGKTAFVYGKHAIDSTLTPIDDIVQFEDSVIIKSNIPAAADISTEELKNIGALLMNYNTPTKCATVLAWVCACFVKEHLRLQDIKFPHLLLVGEAGSGKSTTLERIVMELFSTRGKVSAAQCTPFTVIRSCDSSNLIPYCLDEYKPSRFSETKVNSIHEMLRCAYDSEEGQRGQADQSIIKYTYLAPIVMAGEETPNEGAIKERSNILYFAKKDILQEYKNNIELIRQSSGPLRSLGKLLLAAALNVESATVKKWHDAALKLIPAEWDSRPINNNAVLFCGLELLKMALGSKNLSIEECTGTSQGLMQSYILQGFSEYTLDGNNQTKSELDSIMELLPGCKRAGYITNGVEYQIIAEDQELRLKPNAIYAALSKYMKDYDLKDKKLPYNDFRKQLNKATYTNYKPHETLRIGEKVAKGITVDIEKLKNSCDMEDFFEKESPQKG